MIRVGFMYLLAASAIAGLTHATWLATPLFIIFIALHIAGRLAGTIGPTKCPYCRKRVKLGANVCHHCAHNTM